MKKFWMLISENDLIEPRKFDSKEAAKVEAGFLARRHGFLYFVLESVGYVVAGYAPPVYTSIH